MSKPTITLAKDVRQPATSPSNQQVAKGAAALVAAASQAKPTTPAPSPLPQVAAAQAASAVVAQNVAPIKPRTFPDNALIVVVSTTNPKRPGTKAHGKWGLYDEAKKLSKDGTITVGNMIQAFANAKWPKRRALSALRWDSQHGFIEVTMPGAAPAPAKQ